MQTITPASDNNVMINIGVNACWYQQGQDSLCLGSGSGLESSSLFSLSSSRAALFSLPTTSGKPVFGSKVDGVSIRALGAIVSLQMSSRAQ